VLVPLRVACPYPEFSFSKRAVFLPRARVRGRPALRCDSDRLAWARASFYVHNAPRHADDDALRFGPASSACGATPPWIPRQVIQWAHAALCPRPRRFCCCVSFVVRAMPSATRARYTLPGLVPVPTLSTRGAVRYDTLACRRRPAHLPPGRCGALPALISTTTSISRTRCVNLLSLYRQALHDHGARCARLLGFTVQRSPSQSAPVNVLVERALRAPRQASCHGIDDRYGVLARHPLQHRGALRPRSPIRSPRGFGLPHAFATSGR